jgi:hypothetical protein
MSRKPIRHFNGAVQYNAPRLLNPDYGVRAELGREMSETYVDGSEDVRRAERKAERRRDRQHDSLANIHTQENQFAVYKPKLDIKEMMKERFTEYDTNDPQPILEARKKDKDEIGHREFMFNFDSFDGLNISDGVLLFQSDSRSRNFVNMEGLNMITSIEVYDFYMPKFGTTLGLKEITMTVIGLETQAIKNSNDVRAHFSFKLSNDGDRYLATPRRSRFIFNDPINFTTDITLQFRDPINLIKFPPHFYVGSISLLASPQFIADGTVDLTTQLSTVVGESDIISIPGILDVPSVPVMASSVATDIGAPIPSSAMHSSIYLGRDVAVVYKDDGTDLLSVIFGVISGSAPNETIAWSVPSSHVDPAIAFDDVVASYGSKFILTVGVHKTSPTFDVYIQAIDISTQPIAIFGTQTIHTLIGGGPAVLAVDIKYHSSDTLNEYFIMSAITAGQLEIGFITVPKATGVATVDIFYTAKTFASTLTYRNINVNSTIIGDWIITLTSRVTTAGNMQVYAQASQIIVGNIGQVADAISIFPATEYAVDSHTWSTDESGHLDSIVITNGTTLRMLYTFATGFITNVGLLNIGQEFGNITINTASNTAIIDFIDQSAIALGVGAGATLAVATNNASLISTYINNGLSNADTQALAITNGVVPAVAVAIANEYYSTANSVSLGLVDNENVLLNLNTQLAATGTPKNYVQALFINNTTNTITQLSNTILPSTIDSNEVMVITAGANRFMYSSMQLAAGGAEYVMGTISTTKISLADSDINGLNIANVTTNTFEILNLTFSVTNLAIGAVSIPIAGSLGNITVQVLTKRMRILMKFDTTVRGYTNGILPIKF